MTLLSITASDLNNWTSKEPRRAQELLPKLIWKLVLASSKSIEDSHFPFDSAIQHAGYDGYLVTEDVSSFYPNGISVWEFGTDTDIKKKFNSDFRKRSDNPNGIDTHETTFCFVTSRIWNHKQGIAEFTEEKQRNGVWKSIRVLDANNLEMWLSECPSVAAWFSRIIGKPMDDILSLQDYWWYIVEKTNPKLTLEFFCYGRTESISNEITQMINSGFSPIILCAETKIEGILTLYAALLQSTNIQNEQIMSRMVVVLSSNGFNNACHEFHNAIIIPAFNNDSFPLANDNGFIVPTEKDSPLYLLYKNSPRVTVNPRRRRVFEEALVKIGYDVNEASRIAGDVKCRFSPLLRIITNDVKIKIPSWTDDSNISILIPALFANAWEGNLEGDRIAIEILSGQKYADYLSAIGKYIRGDQMPIFNMDDSFACVSINELWDVLASRIDKSFFENYKKCIQYVFSEVDPTYELPEEKWAAANIYGKKSNFSDRLKKGLIISMAKIVELDENEGFFCFTTSCTRECCNLVFKIYNGLKTINQWRTLVPYMDCFAEATPEAILRIIEDNIAQDSDVFWSLFESPVNPLWGRSFYTNILWALEKLVWLKEYCNRAIYSLVALEEKNYKYKISNCPMDSLQKVFCLWNPQGALTIDERDALLAIIIESKHTIGRRLVNKLLTMTTTTGIVEFSYRYDKCNSPEINGTQYRNSVRRLANKFVETFDSSYEDWKMVVDHFAVFHDIFNECGIDISKRGLELSETDRLRVCADMAVYISNNRKFKDEDDSGNARIVNEMEKIYVSLLPDSPLKYAHYFSNNFYGLNPASFREENYDYNKEEAAIQQLRIDAVEETIDNYGIDSVLTLFQNVSDLRLLVDSLIKSKHFESVNFDYIIQAHLVAPLFSKCLINSVYSIKGISFFSKELINLSDNDVKWIVCQLPIAPDVVELINTFTEDIQDEFWQCADTWDIMRYEENFARECITTLLKKHRPYSALIQLYYAKWEDSGIIVDVLQAALNYHPATEKSDINLNNIDGQYIEKLFNIIYKYPLSDLMSVSQLELAYMNKFSMDFEPKCLVKNVLSDPSHFVELISYCFKKDDEIDEEVSDEKKYVVRLVYDALDRIKTLPGQTGNTIDPSQFNKWIQSVIELAKELKYVKACDIQIGRILSYSPIDEDGIWPHKCVRDFLENNTSETIISNFRIGKYNQRGVYTVTGGDEEKRIAASYDDYAKGLQFLYPKTTRVVEQIRDNYLHESRIERNRELKGYF